MTVKMVQDYGSVSSEMSSQNERNVVDLNVTKIYMLLDVGSKCVSLYLDVSL